MDDDGLYVENDAIADRIRATAEVLRVSKGLDAKTKAKTHELIDAVIETLRPKKEKASVSLLTTHKGQV